MGLFGRNDLYRVHLATVEILESVGVRVDNDEALHALSEAGAIVDKTSSVARLSEELVKEALKHAPSSFGLSARDKKQSFRVKRGLEACAITNGNIHILDLETGERRPATLKDVGDFARLADALKRVMMVDNAVIPQDIPAATTYVHAAEATIKNSVKHYYLQPTDVEQAGFFMKMGEVLAGGSEELRRNPLVHIREAPDSPLCLSRKPTAILVDWAKRRLPVLIQPAPVLGATSPVTIAGAIAQLNAEILASVTVAQLVGRGTPVIYSCAAMAMDPRTAIMLPGSPESLLCGILACQMGHFYDLPITGGGQGMPGRIPDIEAAFERGLNLGFHTLSQMDWEDKPEIKGGFGAFDEYTTASFEQALIDHEVRGFADRFESLVDFSEEALAVQVVRDIGIAGSFLGHKHTYKHLKTDLWLPPIWLGRYMRSQWTKDRYGALWQAARQKVKEILATHEVEPLPKETEMKIGTIVKEADRKLLAQA